MSDASSRPDRRSGFFWSAGKGVKGSGPKSLGNKHSAQGIIRFSLVNISMLLLFSVLLVGCSLFGDDGQKSTTTGTPTPAEPVALTRLHWCNNKPAQTFTDSSALTTPTPVAGKGPAQAVNLGPANGTPVTIKEWDTFKANLSFTVFLPQNLPAGSCLLSASGEVRSAVLGSRFALTYLLPDRTALTIAEAPQLTQNKTLQCSESDTAMQSTPTATTTATKLPLQVCSGTYDTTNVTFSARWKIEALRQFFTDLKPNLTWVPAA